ncbi:MAG: hypothetical protein IV090_10340 [Candidatus Sericytochromatia bacterium]|nr:hypothetical protein [Candidatus Sericytochromatia bacterium]
MRKIVILSLLLAGCFAKTPTEEKAMIQNPPDLKQYQNMLHSMRQANQHGHLTVPQIKQAIHLAQGFKGQEQTLALDILKQTVSTHGTKEAKSFYSLNPELNLVDVFSAVHIDSIPESLLQLLNPDMPGLSLDRFRQLPAKDQTQLLEFARTAQNYYLEKAESMRSAVNPISAKAETIGMFLLQAQTEVQISENN